MNIGIRLHDVEQGDIRFRLAKAADQGFGCAHLALAPNFPGYKMTLPELTPGWAMEIKKDFARENLDCAVLGSYLCLADDDPDRLKKTQEVYKAHLRFASVLGAGVVGTESPTADPWSLEDLHTDKALELFIRGLEPVVKYAENVGQILALEPVFRHTMYNPKAARRVLDAISSPNLMIIFDPVNLLHESNYEQRDEIFAEAMDLLANEIAVLHIKDFNMVDGKLISSGAGTGIMDYTSILKFAKEKKPFIHATLEDTVPANAQQCREFIQEKYDSI